MNLTEEIFDLAKFMAVLAASYFAYVKGIEAYFRARVEIARMKAVDMNTLKELVEQDKIIKVDIEQLKQTDRNHAEDIKKIERDYAELIKRFMEKFLIR